MLNYHQQKMAFLDSLEPNDFRNGESFNQAELIIDQINESFAEASINNRSPEEFIKKAYINLFRENSPAIPKAINLALAYSLQKRT